MKKFVVYLLAIGVLFSLAGCRGGKAEPAAEADGEVAEADTEGTAYTEEEITVTADPDMPLGGTLTLPKSAEKAPVVILVHGSGASDRDENVFGNKPFADIAHGLAEKGIASLRYDKRHFVYPENAGELGASLTLRDEALDDVSAAIELMEKDERVDGSRVFVLGHSLGGMLTPAIASEHPELSGVISMAGTLRQLYDIIYDQNQELVAGLDMSAMSDADKATLDAQLAQLDTDVKTLSGDISGVSDDTLLVGIPAGYWKSCKEYNGMNFIDDVTMPMLILQGGADFQVYPEKDYALWQQTLEGRDNVTFKLYDGLNHLMMPTHGLRSTDDYQTVETVDSQVIEDIAAFVGSVK